MFFILKLSANRQHESLFTTGNIPFRAAIFLQPKLHPTLQLSWPTTINSYFENFTKLPSVCMSDIIHTHPPESRSSCKATRCSTSELILVMLCYSPNVCHECCAQYRLKKWGTWSSNTELTQ